MIYLAENLRECRRKHNMTQEEVAQALNVAPQTVSKWERSETYPDIQLLPALAHLFHTSTDALLGMDRLEEQQRMGAVYTEARVHLSRREWDGAIRVYENALHIWPNDGGLMTDLAMALAMTGHSAKLARAEALCRQVLAGSGTVKVQHTARAALCYICQLMGRRQMAAQTARELPHRRESREVVQERLAFQPLEEELRALIYELSTGCQPEPLN